MTLSESEKKLAKLYANSHTPWQYETFYTYGDGRLISRKVAEFLNRKNVKEFHIVVQKADHVEIIYREGAR